MGRTPSPEIMGNKASSHKIKDLLRIRDILLVMYGHNNHNKFIRKSLIRYWIEPLSCNGRLQLKYQSFLTEQPDGSEDVESLIHDICWGKREDCLIKLKDEYDVQLRKGFKVEFVSAEAWEFLGRE